MLFWIVRDLGDATLLLTVKLGFHMNVALSGRDQCVWTPAVDGVNSDTS